MESISQIKLIEEQLIEEWNLKSWSKKSPLISLYEYLESYTGTFFLLITSRNYIIAPLNQTSSYNLQHIYQLINQELMIRKSSTFLFWNGNEITSASLCDIEDVISGI